MNISPKIAGLALLALPLSGYASFEPISYNAQSAYAGTSSGYFNYLSSQNVSLGGAPYVLDEPVTSTSGSDSAYTRRQVSIDTGSAWLRCTNSTSGRTSCGADGWLDFVVTDGYVQFDYTVAVSQLVWWDAAIVRVYDMTANTILVTKEATSTGTMNIAVTPGHTLRLYAGINQNNIMQGSSGSTAFVAECRLIPVPVVPVSMTIAPNPIAGGGVATATVTTNIPAPTGGTVITLTESAPQLTCPPTVTIAAGETSATFPVTTTYTPTTIVRTVNASSAGTSVSANITLTKIQMATFSLAPVNLYGGNSSIGTITLTAPAPPGFSILVTDDMPYVYSPLGPVQFVAGETSASFTITTRPTATTYTANVKAVKATQNWVRPLNVLQPALSTLTVSKNNVVGGTIITATVTILGTGYYGGVPIALTSDGPELIPPAAAVVSATLTSKTVSVRTTAVTTAVTRVLTATYDGVTRTKSVYIHR